MKSKRKRNGGHLTATPLTCSRALFSLWTNNHRILVYPQRVNAKHSHHPPKKFMRSDLKNSFQGESIWKMTNPDFFLTDPSSWLGQRWPRLGEAHTGAGSRKVNLNNEWGWGWRQKEFFLKIPRRGWRCLGQHPWEPGPCPEGKLSCYSGRVHTYTPASGFRGFPYL